MSYYDVVIVRSQDFFEVQETTKLKSPCKKVIFNWFACDLHGSICVGQLQIMAT